MFRSWVHIFGGSSVSSVSVGGGLLLRPSLDEAAYISLSFLQSVPTRCIYRNLRALWCCSKGSLNHNSVCWPRYLPSYAGQGLRLLWSSLPSEG